MGMKHAIIMAGLALGAMSGAAKAAYIVTFQQVGNNVVATGSGSLNTIGLSSSNFVDAAQVNAAVGNLLLGPSISSSATQYNVSVSGSGAFGGGDFFYADSGSGNFAGVFANGDDSFIGTPIDYVSGTDLGKTTDTWTNASFASLGLTPGTYTYFYGPGEVSARSAATLVADTKGFDTFTIEIGGVSAVPLPASAPMFGAALMALGAVGYGMKRKAKAAAAA